MTNRGENSMLASLQKRKAGTPPVEALRLFAGWAVANQRPYVRFFEEGSDKFMAAIEESEALKARSRAIRDELTDSTDRRTRRVPMKRKLPDPDREA